MRSALWLGGLLLGVSGAGAAAGAWTEDFLVQVWDADRGLPDSSISSIAQTPDGYLWVGTFHGGLARFDGVRFVTFHAGNTADFPSMEVRRLLVDPNGTLWIGTVEGMLLSWRQGRFHFERASTLTPESWLYSLVSCRSNEVILASYGAWLFHGRLTNGTNHWETFKPPEYILSHPVCEDRQGRIWFQRPGWKIGWHWQGEWHLPDTLPGLRDQNVLALASDHTGRIWVGTGAELALWDGQTFIDQTPTNGPANIAIRQLAIGPDNAIWMRTADGFRMARDRRWRVVTEPVTLGQRGDLHPLSLHPDSRGGVWLARTVEGLWYLDAAGRLVRIGREQGLPSDLIETFFIDREGNAWVGLYGGGLACVRPRSVHTRIGDQPLLAEETRSVAEDAQGRLWFGTSGNHLVRVQENQVTTLPLPIERAAAIGTLACPDRQGRVWIGSVQNGVWLWENDALRRPFPLDAVGTVARAIFEDRAGQIWIGNEFGLYRWAGEQLKKYEAADGFSEAFITSFAEDPKGGLWMGTAKGELRCLQDGRFVSFRPPDREPLRPPFNGNARGRGALSGFEQFWALHADADGDLWIGTLGGGLLHFRNGKFTRFTERDGLPNEHVTQILEDDLGHLWLGTRGGLVRVKKQALLDYAAARSSTLALNSYGRYDGLPTIECSGGSQPGCWRTRDGRLWFSTVKGPVWVDPARVPFNPLPPPVHIEEFSVDKQLRFAPALIPHRPPPADVAPARPNSLRIPPGQHYFEFKFTALSFAAPDKVRFRWELRGGERPLRGAGPERSVTFSHLLPGDYEFWVTACNNDGVWNETGTSLSFTVLPHFWERWWFKLVILLLVAGVLAGLYLVRVGRLRAMERLRLRIARDLHDEVGSNLGSISLLAQVLERNPNPEDAREVQHVAAQTVDTLRDIVWFIDPAHERLSDLVSRMRDTAKSMLRNLPYEFQVEGNFEGTPLPLDFRRNLLPIFKEALNNALKHAQATHIKITVRCSGKHFTMIVSDNGRGLPPDSETRGYGLKNIRRRAEEMGAVLDISSAPGAGTTVRVEARLP